MDPDESADVTIWNANLDAIDTEIKTTADTVPEDWWWERWQWVESSNFITASGLAPASWSWSSLTGEADWTLHGQEGTLATSPITFTTGTDGFFQINVDGVYRIYFTATFDVIPTADAEATVVLGILSTPGNVIQKLYLEPAELYKGDQVVSIEWLVDVRADGTGDLVTGGTHKFAVGQNSSSNSVTFLGGVETFDTFIIFELVRN